MSALNQAPQLPTSKQTVDEYAIHEPATCFHCGLPTSPNPRLQIKFNGVFHAVCCIGCEAVVNTIISAGLGNYYVTRTAAPNTSAPFELAEIDVAKRLAAFDLPTIQPQYLTAASADKLKSAAFYIDGVTCNACLWLAEAALKQVPGVAEVSVNYVTHRAEVAWQPSENNPTSPSGMPGYLSTIVEAIARVGLRAIPVASHERQALRVQAKRKSLKQLGVALLAMMQVMMFTVPLYFASPGDVAPDRSTSRRRESAVKGRSPIGALNPAGSANGRTASVAVSITATSCRPSIPLVTIMARPSGEIGPASCCQGVAGSQRQPAPFTV